LPLTLPWPLALTALTHMQSFLLLGWSRRQSVVVGAACFIDRTEVAVVVPLSARCDHPLVGGRRQRQRLGEVVAEAEGEAHVL